MYRTTRTLTISSLDDNKLYNLDFYASRAGNSSKTDFTINGTVQTIATLNNSATKASFSSIAPSAGNITVTIWRQTSPGGSDRDILNGFTIVEKTSSGTPPSAYPTANAGANKGITEPTATVTLVGSGYDPDGTISSYAWTKVSGYSATIMHPSQATTVINKLEPGNYVFRLTVTDNTGLTATSDVNVTVALAPAHKELNVNITSASYTYANSDWNNWNVNSSLSKNNINYADGTASTIDLTLSAQTGTVDNTSGGTTPYNVSRMWPVEVSKVASYNAGLERTLSITSLDNTKKYRLRFYASATNASQTMKFKITHPDSIIVATYYNDSAVAIFDNISPISGTIAVKIWRTSGAFDYLNGFTIMEKGTLPGPIYDKADSNYVYDAIGNLVKDKTERIDTILWTVYGKISEINKTPYGTSTVQKIKYTYDPAGNRISKLVIKAGNDSLYTWYVRDAQGNVMGVYSSKTAGHSQLILDEHHVYGSSRLGIANRSINVSNPILSGTSANLIGLTYLDALERGKKYYELSNHLGNVLVTVTDKKIGHNAGNGQIDYYIADVASANDYYPFGMVMPGRSYSAQSGYRYGFNGKEKDEEVGGAGNSVDFGERKLDTRLARWFSVDKLYRNYPYVSPYSFAFNTPIQAIDPDGEKVLWVNGYYNTGNLSGIAGSQGGQAYWSPAFITRGSQYLKDVNNKFIDGRGKWNSNGKERYNAGFEYAKANYSDLISGMKADADGNITETFKIVSHSMGAAYAEGIVKYLESKGLTVERVLHFSPADTDDFKASKNSKTTQLQYSPDIVLGYKNLDDVKGVIDGVDEYGEVETPKGQNWVGNHALTKSDVTAWDALADLDQLGFKPSHSEDTVIPGKEDAECGCQVVATKDYYSPTGNSNKTNFRKVIKNQTTYESSGKGTYSSGGGVKIVPTPKTKADVP